MKQFSAWGYWEKSFYKYAPNNKKESLHYWTKTENRFSPHYGDQLQVGDEHN